jgi:glycine cleavage system transcriptional repressor
MNELILTAVGKDRPGIVAAVTRVLLKTGCNIEDSNMALVRGSFAMIVALSAPEKLTRRRLLGLLSPLKRSTGLSFTVERNPVGPPARPKPLVHALLSVYGADKPGIVHKVTTLLLKDKINITQVNTRLVEGLERPIYIMILELDIPRRASFDKVHRALKALGKKIGVDITLRRHEVVEF